MVERVSKPAKVTPWFVRMGVYVAVAAVGLVLTFMGFVTPDQVDLWLTQVGSVAAVIGGVLAAVNTSRKSDLPVVDDDSDKSVTVAELLAARDKAAVSIVEARDRFVAERSDGPIFSVFDK